MKKGANNCNNCNNCNDSSMEAANDLDINLHHAQSSSESHKHNEHHHLVNHVNSLMEEAVDNRSHHTNMARTEVEASEELSHHNYPRKATRNKQHK